MRKQIKSLTTWEIVNYLRFERNALIYHFFDRDGLKTNFEVEMNDSEWVDFIKFCDTLEGIYYCTESYLELWADEKASFPDSYQY